ncbi:MAG: hypothetical protein L6R45_29070 [Anaerolineae bacterium]|nr:hypothetical protein [Anaerolineae bacterium]
MSQPELLKKVIQVLEAGAIEYMITGSIVSSLQGEPRSTHDIDILINIQPSAASKLARAFPPPDFYLDEEAILEAINQQSMFNLIDITTGDKIDFWILTREPFDQSRFSRRYVESFMNFDLQVSSPEDTILAKLRWAKLAGGSEKQFTDALRIYEIQFERLDVGYLEQWTKKLKVDELWKRLVDEAEVT